MKAISNMNFAWRALSTLAAATLAACGGGGDSGSSASNPTAPVVATQQVSGAVIDGYIAGVSLCFDNGQGACDPTLPQAVTDINGRFTLNVSGDVTGKRLLARVQAGNVDTTTNTTFQQGFLLSAIVAGANQNITPLTSMVVAQMAAGKSQADATAAVQALASGADVNADYIATGNASVATLASQTVGVLQAYGGTTITAAANVLNAVVATGSPAAVTASSVAQQAAANGTPVDPATALAQPLYAIEGYLSSGGTPFSHYGLQDAVGVPVRDAYTLSGGSLTVPQQLHQGGWVNAPQVGMFDSYITGAGLSNPLSYVMPLSGGYVMKADGSLSAFLSSDQMHPGYAVSSTSSKISATDLLTNDAVTISLSQADVGNQPVSSSLIVPPTNAIRQAMSGVFAPGSTAVYATFQHTHDQAIVTTGGWGPEWANGADVWNPGIFVTPDNAPSTAVLTLGDPSPMVSLTNVSQAVGRSADVSYNVQARSCIVLNIQAGGVVQLAASGKSGCDYSKVSLPVQGKWSIYPRNNNLMVISLPKSATALDINPTVKGAIASGGNLMVALIAGKAAMGYLFPASVPQTYELLTAAQTDLVAVSMHAAAKAIGITLNP
ncbi:hypothetical protein [Ralstonia pseudosolanacearum]|uniref:Lipoprotein n=1 Tax=Ralstonia solanacearum TaxID=305 RepID=A0AA92IEL7_RALSL|nr:hypothetical protein [Ralstonia pseudosolanacearum]QCX49684.1 hypothetical protein E7Z57_11630 [Ralstonia pseudosolanacearum]